jgi:hypothetical protein
MTKKNAKQGETFGNMRDTAGHDANARMQHAHDNRGRETRMKSNPDSAAIHGTSANLQARVGGNRVYPDNQPAPWTPIGPEGGPVRLADMVPAAHGPSRAANRKQLNDRSM